MYSPVLLLFFKFTEAFVHGDWFELCFWSPIRAAWQITNPFLRENVSPQALAFCDPLVRNLTHSRLGNNKKISYHAQQWNYSACGWWKRKKIFEMYRARKEWVLWRIMAIIRSVKLEVENLIFIKPSQNSSLLLAIHWINMPFFLSSLMDGNGMNCLLIK